MKKNWITDIEGAAGRSGDLVRIEALPHMGQRASEFSNGMTGPNGEKAKIEPSYIRRVLAVFKKSPKDELERLRQMLKEAGE